MSKSKATRQAISHAQIAASLKLVEKAAVPFAGVVTLNALQRQRVLKLKRGAHAVIPQIAAIAKHFGVEAPMMPIDEMLSKIDYADALGALHAAVGVLYTQLGDEILRSQGEAWKTATVTYGMLRKAGDGQAIVREQLAKVEEWFRQSTGRTPKASKPAPTAKPAAKSPTNSVSDGANGKPNGTTTTMVS
jgi:hypothetical protein